MPFGAAAAGAHQHQRWCNHVSTIAAGKNLPNHAPVIVCLSTHVLESHGFKMQA
jgi:hypothetical protein